MLAATAVAVLAAADAKAAYYKMVACAGSNGAPPHSYDTNTRSSDYPEGIFHAWNFCTGQGGDPPGNSSYLRIQEHKWGGEAGHGAYGRFVFDTPGGIHFKAAGGYTRQNQNFNSGWRSRFWIASSCCTAQIVSQGKGVSGGGTTSTFAPHLWPLNVYYDFTRFVFEMNCVNSGGCSTDGTNSTDVNGLVFILSDDHSPRVEFENTGRDLLAGRWVRGTQKIDFESDDNESGMRAERVLIDGTEHWRKDHGCNTSVTSANGEWAREYKPCPNNERDRHVSVDTADLADGSHSVKVCVQDFSQYQGLAGTGAETCASSRTIRTDNTPPAAPAGLEVTSANPERYLPEFGAKWSLPPDSGSPIAKVHYEVIDTKGKPLGPQRTQSGPDLTRIGEIEGPAEPGDYRLRVWLEDQVGYTGPPAVVRVPRDTTPPAAPQYLTATPPATPPSVQGFDLSWRNEHDDGAPIDAAFYEVRGPGGGVVVAKRQVRGHDVEAISDLDTPQGSGRFLLLLRLRDAEGNVGSAASVPLTYDCPRSRSRGGRSLIGGLGLHMQPAEAVRQGKGSTLRGVLHGRGAGVPGATLCVFSRVLTDPGREFLGVALTGPDGGYRFELGSGPSRELSVVYRAGQRQLVATATLHTRVRPALRIKPRVVRRKRRAHLLARVPGPHNDQVVIVFQVRQNKGARAFRRCRTRADGSCLVSYRFGRATAPGVYEIRAQVRRQSGYAYLPGNSRWMRLRVTP